MMNIHRAIGIPVAILSTVASTALAATGPTVEPDTGFIRGPEPEWATSHAQDDQSTPDHRQYHRDEVQAHLEWHELNPTSMPGYTRLHRLMHQERNLNHRQFHDPTYSPEAVGPRGSVRAPVLPTATPTAPTVTPILKRSPGVDRTYEGHRPSRRSIVKAAEQRRR
jgi:hypothetical protein